MKTAYVLVAAVILGIGFPDIAEARRKSSREGFNFGASARILASDSRTTAGVGSDQNTHSVTDSQLVTPYLGYATESFNFGLILNAENTTGNSIERSEDGMREVMRDTEKRSKGANLYARFMFGEVFFFETAGGLYEEVLEVKAETKTFDAAGGFVGESDSYQVKGVGPGYHLGAGLELSMGGGFFFTSQYQVRMVQLRDFVSASELGSKRSWEQKRELLFGLAHYTN